MESVVAQISEFLRSKGVEVLHVAAPPRAGRDDVVRGLVDFLAGGADGTRFALLTGAADVMSAFSAMLHRIDWCPNAEVPKLMIFSKERWFTFVREDVDTIPAYFRRWFCNNVEAGGPVCVVCTLGVGDVRASCSRCGAETCSACFPSIVKHDDGDDEGDVAAIKVYTCPCCRHVKPAIDAIAPVVDYDARPAKVWDAITSALMQHPGHRTGLVVAKHPCVVVADARLTP